LRVSADLPFFIKDCCFPCFCINSSEPANFAARGVEIETGLKSYSSTLRKTEEMKNRNGENTETNGRKPRLNTREKKSPDTAACSHYVLITGERGTGKNDDCEDAFTSKAIAAKRNLSI
jgi:hypothetical protein